MNLIDLYVAEVGRNLPPKMSDDIEREIRSLVMDAVDDASQQQGREPDEEMVVGVLRKFGPPQKVAASYQPPQYLIGPNLYPTFKMVVRIVLSVIAIVAAVGVGVKLGGISTGTGWEPVLRTLGEGILGLMNSAVAALGSIVLVFAIIQWLNPAVKFDEKTWDPRQLKAEPDPDRVKPAGVAVEMFLTLVLLVVLNVYPRWIGISTFVEGKWLHAPLLAPAFLQYLPWINLVLIAGVVVNALLIRQGAWTRLLRWLAIACQLASIVLLAWILSGPDIISLNAVQLVEGGWAPQAADGLVRTAPAFSLLIRMALGIALVTQAVDLVKKIYRLVAPNLSLPGPLTQ